MLIDNRRDTVNILVPDVEPEILRKVVEYIYNGQVELESKFMAGKRLYSPVKCFIILRKCSSIDFIEACNLLKLKATILCERKLVFNKVQKSTFAAKATSTPVATTVTKQANLDSLIADLEQEEQSVEYQLKQDISDESGQIVEVYEISNLDDAEITYEDEVMEDEDDDTNYELMNVVSDSKSESLQIAQHTEKTKKATLKRETYSDNKARTPPKPVCEETMNKAINEIMLNTNR